MSDNMISLVWDFSQLSHFFDVGFSSEQRFSGTGHDAADSLTLSLGSVETNDACLAIAKCNISM
jgi:hypothetical protein